MPYKSQLENKEASCREVLSILRNEINASYGDDKNDHCPEIPFVSLDEIEV